MEANEDRLAYIAALIETALAVGLDGADWANRYGLAWLSDAYNGIGPERWPPDLRAKVTNWLHIFEPASLIHDAETTESDGMRKAFYEANARFLVNCLKLANWWYPWYSWKRYRARAIAHVLFECVNGDQGWNSWQRAHRKRMEAATASGQRQEGETNA